MMPSSSAVLVQSAAGPVVLPASSFPAPETLNFMLQDHRFDDHSEALVPVDTGLRVTSESSISVDITASIDEAIQDVATYGYEKHIITEGDADAFGIGSTGELKRAVRLNFGRTPNGAWLRSPAGSHKLYDTYPAFKEVAEVLKVLPEHTEVYESKTEPSILTTTVCENRVEAPFDCRVSISHSVAKTVTSVWSSTQSVTMSETIGFRVKFPVGEYVYTVC